MSRRLPVYLLIDVSGSMAGEPIAAVENGIQALVSELKNDSHALETVYLSMVSFSSSAKQIAPLTELLSFNAPQLTASGTTALGAALSCAANAANAEIVKNSPETKGDWRPLVFIMTDGYATDDVSKGLEEFRKVKWGVVVACAAGSGANEEELTNITENVVKLDTASASDITKFFQWVTASVLSSANSVGTENKQLNAISKLPPPPPEIKII